MPLKVVPLPANIEAIKVSLEGEPGMRELEIQARRQNARTRVLSILSRVVTDLPDVNSIRVFVFGPVGTTTHPTPIINESDTDTEVTSNPVEFGESHQTAVSICEKLVDLLVFGFGSDFSLRVWRVNDSTYAVVESVSRPQ